MMRRKPLLDQTFRYESLLVVIARFRFDSRWRYQSREPYRAPCSA
jgi:hypothetical protein